MRCVPVIFIKKKVLLNELLIVTVLDIDIPLNKRGEWQEKMFM